VDIFRPTCNNGEYTPFLLANLKTLELVELNDINARNKPRGMRARAALLKSESFA